MALFKKEVRYVKKQFLKNIVVGSVFFLAINVFKSLSDKRKSVSKNFLIMIVR